MAFRDQLTRTDLSGDASSFVGRRREVSTVRRLLHGTRLLTLTGPGGVGKTRLALHAADTLARSFKDGVALVELAKLEDADLLEFTVAESLGLRAMGPQPMSTLVDYLAAQRMLLVLDNCEHLLDRCAHLVAALMRGTSRLRILATSRQSLGVYGEQVLVVPSLSVPESGDPLRTIARHEAVRLFVDRAASARPGFALGASNAAAVARLSRRLDGIPLAIELAAVRLRTHSVDQLTRELDGRFPALTGGGPAALPRHQTLRATMDWSFELCSPGERRLWSRLSMFATSVELETVEEVCSDAEIGREDVLELMSGLVDKSLLVAEPGPGAMRYHMLESIRAYGREQLSPSESQALGGRFIDYYQDLVKRRRAEHLEPDQLETCAMLRLELPNIRVALETCFSREQAAPMGLEMVASMWGLWVLTGSLTEGRHWLERGLGIVRARSAARAMGLWADCLLALHQGDLAAAEPRLEECTAFARESGDEWCLASTTEAAGIMAFSKGDSQRGFALLEEARARYSAYGDLHAVGIDLFFASSWGAIDDPDRAAALGQEFLAMAEDRHALACRAYAQFAVATAMWNLGDWRRTEELMKEAAEFRAAINDRWGLAQCLEVLAWTAGARGEHDRAARVLGAAHTLWRELGASPERMWPHARWHEHCMGEAREALGNRAFAAAFRSGGKAGLEEAVEHAINCGGERQ